MKNNRLLKGISLFTFLFILIPLLMIVVSSFSDSSVIRFPIEGFTFKWFKAVFKSRSFMSGLKTSFFLAIISASIAILVSLPLVYALYSRKTRWNQKILNFFLSPSLVPGIILGFLLFKVFVLELRLPLGFALILGHVLLVLPYGVRILSAGLAEFDASIDEAARSLGCTRLQSFYYVILPHLKSSLVGAFMMSFITSFNNLPVSMFLKGPGVSTLPVALMNHIEYHFDPSVSALSVCLMLITFVLMYLFDHFFDVKKVI